MGRSSRGLCDCPTEGGPGHWPGGSQWGVRGRLRDLSKEGGPGHPQWGDLSRAPQNGECVATDMGSVRPGQVQEGAGAARQLGQLGLQGPLQLGL